VGLCLSHIWSWLSQEAGRCWAVWGLTLVYMQETISSLKTKLAGITNVPVERQRLIFQGRVLQDALPLSQHSMALVVCSTFVSPKTTKEVASTVRLHWDGKTELVLTF
jgi:hypothetical protein